MGNVTADVASAFGFAETSHLDVKTTASLESKRRTGRKTSETKSKEGKERKFSSKEEIVVAVVEGFSGPPSTIHFASVVANELKRTHKKTRIATHDERKTGRYDVLLYFQLSPANHNEWYFQTFKELAKPAVLSIWVTIHRREHPADPKRAKVTLDSSMDHYALVQWREIARENNAANVDVFCSKNDSEILASDNNKEVEEIASIILSVISQEP